MTPTRRLALGATGAFTALLASCQVVAGIEPWSVGGAASTGSAVEASSSTGVACGCVSDCFGGDCDCNVCLPREVGVLSPSKCAAVGALRCIAAAPDHVMVIENDAADSLTLYPKAAPDSPVTVLDDIDVRDVAWVGATGFALSLDRLYSGDASKPWDGSTVVQVPAAPTSGYLVPLRFGGGDDDEVLGYVDDSRGGQGIGLYSLTSNALQKRLTNTYVAATTDGESGFAVVASSPSSYVNVFDAAFVVAGNSIDVTGAPALDLTGGGGRVFALLTDGTILVKEKLAKELSVIADVSKLGAYHLVWTSRYVYGSDKQKLFRFSTTSPWALDEAFTRETPDLVDFDADEQGVYWVTSNGTLVLLDTRAP